METDSRWLTERCRNEVLVLGFYSIPQVILVVSGVSSGVGILVRHLASTDLLWASIGFVPVALSAGPSLPCLTAGDIDKHRHQWPNLKGAACPSLSPFSHV